MAFPALADPGSLGRRRPRAAPSEGFPTRLLLPAGHPETWAAWPSRRPHSILQEPRWVPAFLPGVGPRPPRERKAAFSSPLGAQNQNQKCPQPHDQASGKAGGNSSGFQRRSVSLGAGGPSNEETPTEQGAADRRTAL